MSAGPLRSSVAYPSDPTRDSAVKLPRDERAEVRPPTAVHVEAVWRLLPNAYRLPLLVLDATGMRVGELEALTWGDLDELAGRWRVSQAVAKTRRARWVPVPEQVFEAVAALVPREDRELDRQVFAGFGADRLRTAITRRAKRAGVPAFLAARPPASPRDALAPERRPGRRGRVVARALAAGVREDVRARDTWRSRRARPPGAPRG